MEKIKTIYFINGSSIGGGELDSIIRANISKGIVVCLNKPDLQIISVFKKLKIKNYSLKDYINYLFASKGVFFEIHTNSFLRDLKYIPIILLSKIIKLNNIRFILEVHSDPRSGLRKINIFTNFFLFFYELFGYVFANKIRFVSHRQLNTFQILAQRSYFIDSPTSFLTREAKVGKEKISKKKYDLLFIGRLTNSTLLGDTKNKNFLISLIKKLENKKYKIIIISDLNKNENELIFDDNIELIKPNIEIVDYLKKSKILIVPSIHEGYSLITKEASLLGCKVIGSSAIAPEIQSLKNVSIINNFKIENWSNLIEKLLRY